MAMLKYCISDEGLCTRNILKFTEDEDVNDMQSAMVKSDLYCTKQINDILERFQLRQRHWEPNESFDASVVTLRGIIALGIQNN